MMNNVDNITLNNAKSDDLFEYRSFALTTFDNPFNPFIDFDSWFLFDCEKNYYSLSKLARLSNVDDSMSSKEEAIAIESAIERLIEIDPSGIYMKVYKPGLEPDEKAESAASKDTTTTEKA